MASTTPELFAHSSWPECNDTDDQIRFVGTEQYPCIQSNRRSNPSQARHAPILRMRFEAPASNPRCFRPDYVLQTGRVSFAEKRDCPHMLPKTKVAPMSLRTSEYALKSSHAPDPQKDMVKGDLQSCNDKIFWVLLPQVPHSREHYRKLRFVSRKVNLLSRLAPHPFSSASTSARLGRLGWAPGLVQASAPAATA